MRKGVTPVIASIMLVAIAVSLAILLYYGITSILSETTTRTMSTLERELDLAITNLKIIDFGNCKIMVLNTGGTDVPLESVYIYRADVDSEIFKEVSFSPSKGIINKYESLEMDLDIPPGYYKLILKVLDKTMDYGFITCSPFFCDIKPDCEGNETPIIALSGTTNARAELPTEGNYNYKLCCSKISSVSYLSACPPSLTGFVTLSTNSTNDLNTNARAEKYNYTGSDGFDYKKSVCVNFTEGNLECIYDTKSNCNAKGYSIYLFSISGETNARIGNELAYPLVFCCKYG